MKKIIALEKQLRSLLIEDISTAVKKAGGCIGTIYKNIGVRYQKYERKSACPQEYEYNQSPVFPVNHNGHYLERYDGYEGVILYEIYLSGIHLNAIVHGVSGDDLDIEADVIPIEGLREIRQWLVKHGFIDPEN